MAGEQITNEKIPLTIKNGTFRCNLIDINIAFITLPMVSVRKILSLMYDKPYQNERAIETCQSWLNNVSMPLNERLINNNERLLKTLEDMEAKRRVVASMGSPLEQEIDNAKKQLTAAKRSGKRDRIQNATAAYNAVRQPVTEYEKAEKQAKFIKKLILDDERKMKRIELLKKEISPCTKIFQQKY